MEDQDDTRTDFLRLVAIALNNRGSSLLRQGAFRAAVKTMKDSIACVKMAASDDLAESDSVVSDALAMLQRSRASLESCTPSWNSSESTIGTKIPRNEAKSDPTSDAIAAPMIHVQVTVCHYDYNDLASLVNTMHHEMHPAPRSPGRTMFALHLDESLSSFANDLLSRENAEHPLDLESAVMVYNFAVAHICLAEVEPDLRERHAQRANNLLDLARTLLENIGSEAGSGSITSALSLWLEFWIQHASSVSSEELDERLQRLRQACNLPQVQRILLGRKDDVAPAA